MIPFIFIPVLDKEFRSRAAEGWYNRQSELWPAWCSTSRWGKAILWLRGYAPDSQFRDFMKRKILD